MSVVSDGAFAGTAGAGAGAAAGTRAEAAGWLERVLLSFGSGDGDAAAAAGRAGDGTEVGVDGLLVAGDVAQSAEENLR